MLVTQELMAPEVLEVQQELQVTLDLRVMLVILERMVLVVLAGQQELQELKALQVMLVTQVLMVPEAQEERLV